MYKLIFGLFLACSILAHAEPKHVILIIGDGMDDHQLTIARNYLHGPQGKLTMDSMPLRSSVQVLAVDEASPSTPLFVAESAGSGTAMATGIVTSKARISTSAKVDKAVPTILELAKAEGLATGVISSANITDATPAVFMAHINKRFCTNPSAMLEEESNCEQYLTSRGGLGSIAEQIALSDVDLALGGGAQEFAVELDGTDQPVRALAEQNNFQVIDQRDQLANLAPGKVLGLFAEDNFPAFLRGEDGRSGEKADPSLLNSIHWALGSVELPEPMACEPNPEFGDTPKLGELTEFGINRLKAASERGFVLVVESALVDKRAHVRDACGSIGEVDQLEDVLKTALAFAQQNPETLILVTADHSQAAQLIPSESLFAQYGVPVYSPGHLVRIKTNNSVMTVNYATNDFFAEEHTGAAVPLFTNRVDIGVPVYMLQTEVFEIMKRYLGL